MDLLMQSPRIIVVDDEKLITQSIQSLLLLEFETLCMTFNNPVEALEYIKSNTIDLVISDFLMPQMNGIEFLKQVKAYQPGATSILLTGYSDKENAIKAINEVGIYRYLEKPWDNDDFLLSIKTGLERSHLIEKLETLVEQRTKDLNKTNIKLNAVLNSCADGIITIKNNGNISAVNPSFMGICAKSENEIVNLNVSTIIQNTKNYISNLNNTETSLITECYIENAKLNKTIPVEINIAPLTIENSDEFVVSVRDITAQKETEQLRDDFIATLAHDLRTPLQASIQTLRFFVDGSLGSLGERQQKFLETMLLSNQDMLYLVNSLLEVYRYESGQLYLSKESFNLSELINQCVQEVEPLLSKKSTELRIQIEKNIIIKADRLELKRVIANLVGNAIKFTKENGAIVIKTDILNSNVKVTVEDNGPGIPENEISKLFKRFSQGTTIKRSTGTGLGLYLSRQIISAHDGSVFIDSKVGKGSKFGFIIPV